MKLSIIIPALNEEQTIAEVLSRVQAQALPPGWDREIIVVNDGSTDGTAGILANLQLTTYNFTTITHEANQGKGSAIQSALKTATGDAIIIQDADLEYSPSEFPALIRELELHPEVAAIFGSRNLKPKRRGYSHYVLGAALLTALINLLYRSRLTDSYTCYKLFRSEVIKGIPLQSRGFEFEAEITCKLLRAGHKIKEIPIDYAPRSFAEGKKIRFKDALKGATAILKYRI